jgi:hypothetical protein
MRPNASLNTDLSRPSVHRGLKLAQARAFFSDDSGVNGL